MIETQNGSRALPYHVLDRAPLRPMPTAAFIGYHPFPPVMNLYANYSSGVISAIKSHKLCGATPNDFLYLVEYHIGYTARGPLNFGRGYYLRNGMTFNDPILAATGEKSQLPLLGSLFESETLVKLPPPDMNQNPRDMVDEVLRTEISREHGVTFRFSIEVGTRRLRRETFEWRKVTGPTGRRDPGGHKVRARYSLERLPLNPRAPSTTVAELSFNDVLSFTHLFTLELKGAGLTGELGDRWTLMVVTTALSLHLLRQLGKAEKVSGLGDAEKVDGT
ncbi:uncharacterized protein P884DRAFT_256922 [Thermothelomyces heterothallicus CBS 202.75]|uniref:uncharacterized protein n=1 Tax=Thermothelomyces heterothallicus CBS 202.75 TaxID=1149848 RepID=UPI00374330D7